MDISLSSLLPKIPPKKIKIVGEILDELVRIITDTDKDKKEDTSTNETSEKHDSPDIARNNNSEICNKSTNSQNNCEISSTEAQSKASNPEEKNLCKTTNEIPLNSDTNTRLKSPPSEVSHSSKTLRQFPIYPQRKDEFNVFDGDVSKTKFEDILKQIIAIAGSSLETGKISALVKGEQFASEPVLDVKSIAVGDGIQKSACVVTTAPSIPADGSLKTRAKAAMLRKAVGKMKSLDLTSKIDARKSTLMPTVVKTGTVPRKPLQNRHFSGSTSYLKEETSKSTKSEAKISAVRKTGVYKVNLQKKKSFGTTGSAASGSKL